MSCTSPYQPKYQCRDREARQQNRESKLNKPLLIPALCLEAQGQQKTRTAQTWRLYSEEHGFTKNSHDGLMVPSVFGIKLR